MKIDRTELYRFNKHWRNRINRKRKHWKICIYEKEICLALLFLFFITDATKWYVKWYGRWQFLWNHKKNFLQNLFLFLFICSISCVYYYNICKKKKNFFSFCVFFYFFLMTSWILRQSYVPVDVTAVHLSELQKSFEPFLRQPFFKARPFSNFERLQFFKNSEFQGFRS